MNLEWLSERESFALLAPGFDPAGRWTCLIDLRTVDPAASEGPTLVFAAYETPGSRAERWTGTPRPIGEGPDVDSGHIRPAPCDPSPTVSIEEYRQRIEAIRRRIAVGDVYQVNLTVRVPLPPWTGAELLRRLCRRGIPRFAAWVRLPDGREWVSASPELLAGWSGRRIWSEPMKGTAPANQVGTLESSAKDRAELAMITDLVRHDLTPLCREKSVCVTEARRLIRLPYVVQAVSDVEGELESDPSVHGILDALHPGGSVTGAPKNMARSIIRTIEDGDRGPYCGTLGLVQRINGVDEGRCALLIRTAERTPEGWIYGVGSGIVWDSTPEGEWEEIHWKMGALR